MDLLFEVIVSIEFGTASCVKNLQENRKAGVGHLYGAATVLQETIVFSLVRSFVLQMVFLNLK